MRLTGSKIENKENLYATDNDASISSEQYTALMKSKSSTSEQTHK